VNITSLHYLPFILSKRSTPASYAQCGFQESCP
jgi:hypothetical protein